MDAAFLAVVTFLIFSAGGYLAQVVKLLQRRRRWQRGELEEAQICEGLHPVRELWSFSAFSLFALSGLTRSYIDYVLVGSRVPAVILSTITIWLLSVHQRGRARRYFQLALCVNALFLVMFVVAHTGFSLGGTHIATGVDMTLSFVSFFLFYGKMTQARLMISTRRTAAVSWLREIGLVLKDITGLWYAVSVGQELIWVSVTHTLSLLSSSGICVAKFFVEHRTAQSDLDNNTIVTRSVSLSTKDTSDDTKSPLDNC